MVCWRNNRGHTVFLRFDTVLGNVAGHLGNDGLKMIRPPNWDVIILKQPILLHQIFIPATNRVKPDQPRLRANGESSVVFPN
jgi:hypothetical protein